MTTVSVRELRNQGGDILARVEQGRSIVVTRDGIAVAELRPLRRRSPATSELIARRAALPSLDPDALRADIDSVIDSTL